MKGDNLELNKKNFFNKKCDQIMLDEIEENFEFYKRIVENKQVKNKILQLLYEDCH